MARFCFWWELIHLCIFLHQHLSVWPGNGKGSFKQMKYCSCLWILRILWFLSPTREGCEVICLWLCFFSPSATALAWAGPAALTHFPRWHDQHQPSSTCTDELCHCLRCTRDLLEERWFPISWIPDSDGAGYKSYFHGADEFLFCRLQWTFLSSKLHGPAVYFTGIYCLYKYFIGRCQAL